MITSKEARLNLAIATENRALVSATKEDSTAMKTLAIVTVLFLPGTFVSALFAVPLFQWDASGKDRVISGRLWIYWAIAIPLTLMIFIPWAIWTRMKASENRRSLEQATRQFKKAVDGLGEHAVNDDDSAEESGNRGIGYLYGLEPSLSHPELSLESGMPHMRKRFKMDKLAERILRKKTRNG